MVSDFGQGVEAMEEEKEQQQGEQGQQQEEQGQGKESQGQESEQGPGQDQEQSEAWKAEARKAFGAASAVHTRQLTMLMEKLKESYMKTEVALAKAASETERANACEARLRVLHMKLCKTCKAYPW